MESNIQFEPAKSFYTPKQIDSIFNQWPEIEMFYEVTPSGHLFIKEEEVRAYTSGLDTEYDVIQHWRD